MQKVLLIGATGFLGKNFLDFLQVSGKYEIYSNKFDITKNYLFENIVNQFKPDIILNFAGKATTYTNSDLCDYISINSLPVISQLEYLNKIGYRGTYFNLGSILEHSSANTGYIISKRISHSYIKKYQNKIKCRQILLCNIIGKEQSENFIFNKLFNFIKNYKEGDKPLEIGSIDSYRSFLFIEDFGNIFYNLINNTSDIFGIDQETAILGNPEISIRDLVIAMCANFEIDVYQNAHTNTFYLRKDKKNLFPFITYNTKHNIENTLDKCIYDFRRSKHINILSLDNIIEKLKP